MRMKLPRKYRILTALIALFSLLFMQMAVASYACPGLQVAGGSESVVGAEEPMTAMPGCDQPDLAQLDAAQPALCHAHCLDAKTSLDKPEVPSVSPAVPIVSAILVPLLPLLAEPRPAPQQPFFLRRTTAPPISIRHCCFRI
jgi:hypothetical protein